MSLALIGIGIWGIYAALARASRAPRTHGTHVHGHAAFAVGTLHGLAGSAHLLGILPALTLPSDFAAERAHRGDTACAEEKETSLLWAATDS